MEENIDKKIMESFQYYFPGLDEQAHSFLSHYTLAEFKKGVILKPLNAREEWISIILEGGCAVFSSREMRDVCLDISLEGEFFFEYESCLAQQPSHCITRTLGHTLLARIPIYQNKGKEPFPGLEKMVQHAAIYMFRDRQERLIDVLTESPLTRYKKMCQQSPNLIKDVSNTILASYLGISREHLSRIRSDY